MNNPGVEIWELSVRESVRQTLADYTAGTDRYRLDDVAACFAPGGALSFTGGTRSVGPAAIAAGLATQVGGFRAGPVPLTHVRHHISSVCFGSVSPDRVGVSSYFLVLTDIGVDHWGSYRDVLILFDGRWLFASREAIVDGFSENSLMRAD
jgi:hypothetical protein